MPGSLSNTQETFVGNAIALHTFSIIVTTAHPFQALAAYVTEDGNASRKHTIFASVNSEEALLVPASANTLAGTNNASSVLMVNTAKIVHFEDAFSSPVMYTDNCDR
jgi:hypothetical protein